MPNVSGSRPASEAFPGQMQHWPLTIDKVISHAAVACPDARIFTRGMDLVPRVTDYAGIEGESRRVSAALHRRGFGAGDIAATFAWNSDHHLALWFGISGIGAVTHPVNPRLSPSQIAWILNHAGDRIVFLDTTFVPLLEMIRGDLVHVELFVILASDAEMINNRLSAISLERFLAEDESHLAPEWGGFDENSACALFYTSGTTSDPKGALYSHRSNTLHAMLAGLAYGCAPGDVIMPVVPMFHANCWGLAHVAPMIGASLVMPGPALDPASLHDLVERYGVTHAAGVPTMWSALHTHLKETGKSVPTLKKLFTAGSAVPRALMEQMADDFGVEIVPAWGMTETSPSGTIGGQVSPSITNPETRAVAKARQGRMIFGIELAIKDDDGHRLPNDGQSAGRLLARGNTVVRSYFRSDGEILDDEGFFDTGDIAVFHPDATMQITDRAKDMIKSGGEWISSIAIEDAVAHHPCVASCAVIGIPDTRWDERPLLVVKRRLGSAIEPDEIREFLVGKLEKWWIPDEIVFADELPTGATGKIDKRRLRVDLADRYGQVGGN